MASHRKAKSAAPTWPKHPGVPIGVCYAPEQRNQDKTRAVFESFIRRSCTGRQHAE